LFFMEVFVMFVEPVVAVLLVLIFAMYAIRGHSPWARRNHPPGNRI
jgi:hypothetical protein